MKTSLIPITLLFILSLVCSDPFRTRDNGVGVNIYFLKDENLNAVNVLEKPFWALILDDIAWISAHDIERYDWSTHLIYLKKEKQLSFEGISVFGKPFVVTANDERCYLGALWSAISSYLPSFPIIMVGPGFNGFHASDIIHLSLEDFSSQGQSLTDPRNDERLKNALIQSGQFSAGIQCTLDRVKVIQGINASSVEYTFTLYNMDKDNLYVLDPERMGSSLFHYFTNGINLDNDSSHYWSENKVVTEPKHWSYWEKSWLSKIESGNSMTRTVQLEGYPHIEPGRYQCTFEFPSQTHIEKEKRLFPDGRIWIGRIKSTVIIIDVTLKLN
jgi:hypothetical protein